ncbi:GNAT family N-acetyltransferase [Streptomyces sp. NBC_01304]|uniref:GNAT family N-acetyltransferase n=1 Tax=Streptomyces sp. NBC_01304 TaxID=2903818 RepID=UPI002E109ACB|nr:GNAT family N-acetyltransferase [Streptomyces sp. NBC_01304]
MTDTPLAVPRPTDDAATAAASAARAAGCTVRTIAELADLDAVCRLFAGIWQPGGENPLVTTELLRAMTKAGNYVAAAFDDDELVGACIGFFGPPPHGALHSHIAGVAGKTRGRSVGFALKVHQRSWALRRGTTQVSWTFDPLVRRNAYFNIGKLAAEPAEYLPNFYGVMNDGINGADDTDRLLVTWRLPAPEVAAACHGSPARTVAAPGAAVALGVTAEGRPAPGRADGSRVLVAVPHDIEQLRRSDPACAADWRSALREALGGLLAEGWRVAGFDRAGWYVLVRKEEVQ